jgi:hypothetical protein
MKEFDKIESSSGTLVIIYNLKLLDSGQPELDVKTDPHDIILTNPDGGGVTDTDDGLMPERKSFRAYASILYVEPRMRVYIQGRKVRTKRLVNTLYKPRLYRYTSARFKTRSEAEAKRAEEDAKIVENRAREAESKAKNLELKYGSTSDKEQRAELRRAQIAAVELRKDAQLKKTIAERKSKALRDPKQLSFVFGINIENRSRDGMFVYNCSRLIKMYQKVGPQADGGVFCSGVVGVVDVPYLVLEPTHNKQDFADAKEYRHLQQAMGEHMLQYWKDLEIAQQGVTKFWENFGYVSPNWRDLPSTDPKFVRKRTAVVQTTLQCDLCLKWRILPFAANAVGKVFPDDWVCSMNPDPAHNRCSSSEEKLNIPEGILKKIVKTKEQKEKELEEEIRRKQSQLDKIQKHAPAMSSKTKQQQQHISSDEEEVMEEEEKVEHTGRRSYSRADERERRARLAAIHERPARRRGIADSESEASNSVHSSSDSDVIDEPPPTKKKVVFDSKSSRGQSTRTVRSPAKHHHRGVELKRESSGRHGNNKRGEHKERHVAAHQTRNMTALARVEEDEDDVELSSDELPAGDTDEQRLKAEVGTRVEVNIEKKWLTGMVVDMNRGKDKWKVVIDKHPDTYQWFDRKSREMRVIKVVCDEASETTNIEPEHETIRAAPLPPAAVAVVDAGTEAPSSSTVALTATTNSCQANEEIANGYRTCLRYFLPPQWIMDKDAVSSLTVSDLAGFPLDDFFDHYEKGLRKLVSSFQQEALVKQQEAELSWSKLTTVRRMIAKLLKSMNDEFDLDPESDSDQVDELLSLCLKQALSQVKDGGGDGATAAAVPDAAE